jgi:hypothetical protein
MKRIKTIYFVVTIIFFILLGIFIVIPEVVPSFESVQGIILSVIYLINIVLAYIVIVRLRNYLQNVFDKTRTFILTAVVGAIVIFGLLFSFLFTSLGIGQGFMGGNFYKELNYPEYDISLYIYDDGFLDPLTTIKIKNKTLPIMNDLFFIENCQPAELNTSKHSDTLELSGQNIIVKVNLRTRDIKKSYMQRNKF